MAMIKRRPANDFGLGTKNDMGGYRAINKDGSFNAKKINVPFFSRFNFFHSLITMPWPHFLLCILGGYLIVNLLFATAFTWVGVENLTGIAPQTPQEGFIEAFFFSAQTITTLGYGRVAPIGHLANTVAAIESMLGLLGFALATGLLYGRFSRPKSMLNYSHNAVVAPYQKVNGFMFRVVNPKNNQLLEMEVQLSVAMQRKNSTIRDFYGMELERSRVAFMPYMWTIVHPITEKSPLYGLNEAALRHKEAEFIVSMKAFDESTSQNVYSRTSYTADEVKWGEKFVYAVARKDQGILIDVGLLNATEPAPLSS